MLYLQAGLLVIAGVALLAVLLGVVRNARGPRKGRYRYSWFEKKR
jgi:hypothetical protein